MKIQVTDLSTTSVKPTVKTTFNGQAGTPFKDRLEDVFGRLYSKDADNQRDKSRPRHLAATKQ